MTKDSGGKGRYRDETLLSVLGRDPAANHGVVNPPVYHASTILHESAAALKEATFGPREYGKTYYGRYGTPTTFPLQDSIAALRGATGPTCSAPARRRSWRRCSRS